MMPKDSTAKKGMRIPLDEATLKSLNKGVGEPEIVMHDAISNTPPNVAPAMLLPASELNMDLRPMQTVYPLPADKLPEEMDEPRIPYKEKSNPKLFRMTDTQENLLKRVLRNSTYKSAQEIFEKEFIPVLERMDREQRMQRNIQLGAAASKDS